ncbi:MAG: tRNA (N6-threonylcarbamoyladenosine(37)-N6)-methyltransferase TrmO [Bdellovibrionales bacterium]|nr:tRNA (N6-threonylcarbamoyladenosine(37)-N6)-methyltransferase TrmO [Bdellovibrionales bacterium]
MSDSYSFEPIGRLKSDYAEKFAVPRQSGLVPEARSELALEGRLAASVDGLEGFSHVWVLFVFHLSQGKSAGRLATARPPRLGGRKRVGVLASRSPFRPNPLGLSLVRLETVKRSRGRAVLVLRGGDFVTGTPVLDVKPYLPWADSVRGARAGWAAEPPPRQKVRFTREASVQLRAAEARSGRKELRRLIVNALSLDPRPPNWKDGAYAAWLGDWNVRWEQRGADCAVTGLEPRVPREQSPRP